MWDTAFNLLSSSQADRNLVTAFVQLICTAIVNFTAGMVSSVFIFVFQLPWLLMSYQVRLSTTCVEVCFLRDVTLRVNCEALAALSTSDTAVALVCPQINCDFAGQSSFHDSLLWPGIVGLHQCHPVISPWAVPCWCNGNLCNSVVHTNTPDIGRRAISGQWDIVAAAAQ